MAKYFGSHDFVSMSTLTIMGQMCCLDVLPELFCILHLCNLKKVFVVGYSKGPHPVLMTPLPEVPLKLSATSIILAPTNLARKFLKQTDKVIRL